MFWLFEKPNISKKIIHQQKKSIIAEIVTNIKSVRKNTTIVIILCKISQHYYKIHPVSLDPLNFVVKINLSISTYCTSIYANPFLLNANFPQDLRTYDLHQAYPRWFWVKRRDPTGESWKKCYPALLSWVDQDRPGQPGLCAHPFLCLNPTRADIMTCWAESGLSPIQLLFHL